MKDRLLQLIPEYGNHKAELDEIDKICKAENAEIKRIMSEEGIDSLSAGGYKVSYSVSERQTMNEAKLLELLHRYIKNSDNIPGIIKTREYVDMDALESAIYNGAIPKEVIIEMDNCREKKQVATIRVSKEKKDGKDNNN